MATPAFASAVTLVAPTTITYVLTNDNPSNTSLVDLSISPELAKPAFTVQTEFTGSKAVTHVKNHQGDIIASLEWREMLPDKVFIRGNSPVSLSGWMKSGFLPLSPVSFRDEQGRKYQWKNVAAGLNMELYAADTPGGPIAAFCKSRINRSTDGSSTPATFVMTARAQEISETCVVSFLFLEKKRRMRENSSQNRADVLGSAAFSPSGHGVVSAGGV